MIQATSAILNDAGLPNGPPSPASAQDVLEDGKIVDSDGGDESDSANSSTSDSDDSVDGTPSMPPRRSARIAKQPGVGQQPPTTSMAFAHFSLNIAEDSLLFQPLHLSIQQFCVFFFLG
jgi:hypothetical protein